MSATGQYQDFSDLYVGLQNAVREQTGVTAVENQAKRAINVALHDMHLGFDYKFPWAERDAVLITHPEYNDGTVSITQGSALVAATDAAFTASNDTGQTNVQAGGKLVINGGTDVYKVSSIQGPNNLTMTHLWISATVSAVSYNYFEDEYALASDFLRPVDQQQFSDAIGIDIISRTEFRQRFTRNYITGKPFVCTFVDKVFSGSTTPVRKIRLHKPPDAAYLIPYTYITSNLAVSAAGSEQTQLSADTDEPIVPLRYRHAILFHALYHWYRDRKDDARSQEAKAEYNDIMLRTISDNEIGATPTARINIRSSTYRRAAQAPYQRRGRGRFDLGGFDRLEE